MFLDEFKYNQELLPFSDKEIRRWDQTILTYEQAQLDPDFENHLISQNQFLASFSISKAEDSKLTLAEAEDLYKVITEDKSYDFISKKLKSKTALTKKDYEKLEFLNIARTFKEVNQDILNPEDLTSDLIRDIHAKLTKGMDVFQKSFVEFTPYKSGKFRDNDLIRVDTYEPPSHRDIPGLVKSLIARFSDEPGVSTAFAFHLFLYATHPFNNGNKRVCRILEHVLLRMAGLNARNIYSPSYYYHLEKPRYYKYLLASLNRKNANYFVAYCQEATVSSQILVMKKGLELKRETFLNRQELAKPDLTILKPLVHRKELQFNQLFDKKIRKKMARQTFVNALNRAVDNGILLRREAGRNVFYWLNLELPEEKVLQEWISSIKAKLEYVSDVVKVV